MDILENHPIKVKQELEWKGILECSTEEALAHIPLDFAKKHRILPISLIKSEHVDSLLLASAFREDDFELKENLKLITQKNILIKQIPEIVLQKAINLAYQKQRLKNKKINFPDSGYSNNQRRHLSLEEDRENQITSLLQMIILNAIDKKASDIHLNSLDKAPAQTSFRIDGELVPQEEYSLNHLTFNKLLRHILVLCELDITKIDKPQEGMFEVSLDKTSIRLRLSSLPTVSGNKLALRLLYHPLLDEHIGNQHHILDSLHIPSSYQTLLKSLLKKKGGLILLSGPTGSGKSTLLYSLIKQASDIGNKNIITIEDPVERKIQGTTQIEINATNTLSYGNILKKLLRQDPDIIVLSEIRDSETAITAIETALSGVLVLSTIHASNVPELILRLLEMGSTPLSLSSTIKLLSSQRLLRTLCPVCKTTKIISTESSEKLRISKHQHVYESSGCPSCKYSGTNGRIAIYEFSEPTFELISTFSQLFSNGLNSVDPKTIHSTLSGSRYLPFSYSIRKLILDGIISEDEGLSILF